MPARFEIVQRTLAAHRIGLAVCLAVLLAANLWTGAPWWTFWPMLALSALFAVHYMVARTLAADDRWADARADDIADRSYDRAHITFVVERYTRPPSRPRRSPGEDRAPGGRATGR